MTDTIQRSLAWRRQVFCNCNTVKAIILTRVPMFRHNYGSDRFNMVSYSPQSRRLAVGAKNGQLALYDLRSSRCQVRASTLVEVQFVF